MPIYEYRCLTCHKKVSIFFRSYASVSDPVCPECGSTNLERLFSRVVVRRGGDRAAKLAGDAEFGTSDLGEFDDSMGMGLGGDAFGDPYGDGGGDPFGFDEDTDPREIARWTRQMSAQIGEPLDADLESALTDLERGADPDEVMDRLEESEPPPLPEE
jgi:putative FmdB family regulatory protein